MRKLILLFFCFLIFISGFPAERFVEFQKKKNSFPIKENGKILDIIYSLDEDEGVIMAIKDLQKDFQNVTGSSPSISNNITNAPCIIIGSLKSNLIKNLIAYGKISKDDLEGKNEKFIIQIIENPVENTDKALVIAGSDKRGTIYGIYELSKQIGVSPWYWWADVPFEKHDNIYIKPGIFTDNEPSVKYRGIFINDEWPSFGKWATEKFGGLNSECYKHVFELILRLKGNFLWPAMWNSAFYDDDPYNGELANKMGIVIGTSHHEPMALAQQDWKRYGKGEWNYLTNAKELKSFWEKGINRAKNWEKVVTIGMRGDGDEAMEDSGNIELMKRIISDQREIIENITEKKASHTAQVWALYKEVQDYYDNGLDAPEDVILLLCDDNWGNIRRLPSSDKPLHKGGYGLYYHLDYVGAPRNSKWINISPIPRIWDQLNLAYENGIEKLWILNVGDIKPMEYPISFFMDMAWNPKSFNPDNLVQHSEEFCRDIFGPEVSKEAARLLRTYAKFNRRVTPELLCKDTYSLDNYNEWERVVAEYDQLAVDAKSLSNSLPKENYSSWFQLLEYPVTACANLYDMYYAQAMNHKLFKEGNSLCNLWGERVEECFQKDIELREVYHSLNSGKWNHIMDEINIGYTSWNTPSEQKLLVTYCINQECKDSINLPLPRYVNYNDKIDHPVFEVKNGYVSIEAQNFTRKKEGKEAKWVVIPEMGRTLSAITPLPITADLEDLFLEYDMEIPSDTLCEVTLRFSPSLNFNKTGLRYAITFNEGPEQIININGDFDGETGNIWHREHIIDSKTLHRLKKGVNTLRFRPLDPNLSLQKIMVNLGGLKDSYLGPPETLKISPI